MSTGAGPFTYYTSGGGSSSRGGSSGRGSGGLTKAQLTQIEKEQEFMHLREQLLSIIEIHRVEFPQVQKPILEKPPRPALALFEKQRKKELLAKIPFLSFSRRKEAKKRAHEMALEDVRKDEERRRLEYESAQREVDAQWARLMANDPETVIAMVDQALEDNKAPAAPVNVEGSSLSVVVLVAGIDDVPEKKPDFTPSDKATVKKMTKLERSDMYLTLVCGHLLATIRESLAVAPVVSDVKAVVVRQSNPDVYGNPRLEVLLTGRYERSNLERVRWQEALPSDIVQEASSELSWSLKGRPRQLQPLDLDEEPELKTFVDVLSEKVLAD